MRFFFVDVVGTPLEIVLRCLIGFVVAYVGFFIFFFVYLLINPSAYPEKDSQE